MKTADPNAIAIPRCPGRVLTRRDFLHCAALAAAAPLLLPTGSLAAGPKPPRKPTAIGLCRRYDFAAVRQTLSHLFDELGEVRRLVKNKHVTIKTNLVNTSEEDVYGVPLWLTVTVHPVVALALASLMTRYGARQVTFCDQLPFRSPDPEAFAGYGFKLAELNDATNGRAQLLNTRNRGPHHDYALVKVLGGGQLTSAWEVHRAYVDTDVLVSLTKLKSHVSGGITGGMKNLFGVPPSSLYGDDLAGQPDETATGYRSNTMHNCTHPPLTSARYFNGQTVKNDHGHNVPRFIVDLATAFPIHLTVIDAISTIQGAEGWWNGNQVSITRPGLLVAGTNPVCTDAVCAALMGFNPDAPDRSWPFANGTNYLALARRNGLGENRIEHLETTGVPLKTARFQYHPTYRRVAAMAPA